MIWTLRNFLSSDSIASDHTIYTFNPHCDDPRLHEYSMARFEGLDEQQSAAVCRFLRYMAASGEHVNERAANEALRCYWGLFRDTDC
jgi:hypothetical protein